MLTKTLAAFLSITAASAGCSSSEAHQKTQKDVQMKSVKIPVEGMSCGSCAARIKKNLIGIDGVLAASVSFDEKSAIIQYDARKLEPNRLVSAISGLGFTAGTPIEGAPIESAP
ncbi:MAG: heavy-metal-associated domain-containing protein [Deltaproteobacteria bacterium]|nr:heavy-metal-associated domain-containing protein [Deltaproteobacteria bacterium]